jgi:tRNA G18 (ribose-2'-O)-methylase SpoU
MSKRKQFRRFSAPVPAADEPAPLGSPYWLFGIHPVEAALANPRRRLHRLLATAEAAAQHAALLQQARARPQGAPRLETVDREILARQLPTGAVHQGLALLAEPLPPVDIYEVCDDLARGMATLKDAGVWCAGLAADATQTLAEARLAGKIAIVLGAEGSGLRRLTREHCDMLLRLPTAGPIAQLNVSNAAAVALYELARGRPHLPSRNAGG